MQSGLTRSTSQQGGASRPSPAGRFTSPGPGSNSAQRSTTTATQHSSSSSFHNNSSTMSAGSPGGGALMHSQQQQQQQQFVTIEEFMSLKRALDRERGQREETVTRLREEIFELKEVRRREKLDATVAFVHGEATRGGQQQQQPVSGGGGGARFPVPQAGPGADHSILGRLHRLEAHQLQMLPQQLEALEDRLRARIDDKVKATAEVTKSEFKRVGDKFEAASKEVAAVKAEAAQRSAQLETALSQLTSAHSKTASQVEGLHTQRAHDDDTRRRIEQELQAHHDFVKGMERELHAAQEATTALAKQVGDELAEGGAARHTRGLVDEATLAREVDRRMAAERESVHELVQSRVRPLEAQVGENHESIMGHLTSLQKLTQSLHTLDDRFVRIEEKCGAVENSVGGKSDEQIRQLEARVEASLASLNAANHARLKELNTHLEAQMADKISCSRDEVEDAVAQQIQEVSDRIEDVARQDANALQQQQQYVRGLVSELEHGSAVASLILDGTEAFIREMRQEHAGVFASCLERIAACRSNAAGGGDDGGASGPTMADAIKILYQFDRGLGSGLNSLREDVGDLRTHIGLAMGASSSSALGNNASPGRVH